MTIAHYDTKICLLKENVPKKYRKWALDCDKPGSLKSYTNLKSSAHYLMSKLKVNEDSDISNREGQNLENSDESENPIVKTILGPKGEIYRIYGTTIEVLDWFPGPFQLEEDNVTTLEDQTLFFITKVNEYPDFDVVKRFPLWYDRVSNIFKTLYIYRDSSKVFKIGVWNHAIHSLNKLKFTIQNHLQYTSIPVDSDDYFVLYDITTSTLNIFNYSTFSLVGEYHVDVMNGNPVFDLKGSTLIYSCNSNSRKLIEKRKLTPVDLSSKKSLLNKLIKTFSNTAMDSMFMFSEVSQNKIKKVLEKRSEVTGDNKILDEKLKDNYRDIFIELYNTINKNSAYVTSVDLKCNKIQFQVSVPTGCTKISISPFDLQFLSVSNRGDEVFLWDYSKADESIVLIDKYIRGKTSAIIDSLNWGSGNTSILCMSRVNGSLHNFINDSLRNYEDLSIRKTKKRNLNNSNNTNMSWCLSCLKIQNFSIVRPIFTKDFIVALSEENDLLLIDMESGRINGILALSEKKFEMSFEKAKSIFTYIDTPIRTELLHQEIEIETCKPFLPVYNNKDYKFTMIDEISICGNLFNDISSAITKKKEYNIAGKLYMNKFELKLKPNSQEEVNELLSKIPIYNTSTSSVSDVYNPKFDNKQMSE